MLKAKTYDGVDQALYSNAAKYKMYWIDSNYNVDLYLFYLGKGHVVYPSWVVAYSFDSQTLAGKIIGAQAFGIVPRFYFAVESSNFGVLSCKSSTLLTFLLRECTVRQFNVQLPNLRYLVLSQVTCIGVSLFYGLKQLTYLVIDGCDLHDFDLQWLPNPAVLSFLTIKNSNLYRFFNMGKAIYLRRLNVYRNALHSLLFSNQLLEYVDASENRLAVLDVEQCPLLRQLLLSGNRLSARVVGATEQLRIITDYDGYDRLPPVSYAGYFLLRSYQMYEESQRRIADIRKRLEQIQRNIAQIAQ